MENVLGEAKLEWVQTSYEEIALILLLAWARTEAKRIDSLEHGKGLHVGNKYLILEIIDLSNWLRLLFPEKRITAWLENEEPEKV